MQDIVKGLPAEVREAHASFEYPWLVDIGRVLPVRPLPTPPMLHRFATQACTSAHPWKVPVV